MSGLKGTKVKHVIATEDYFCFIGTFETGSVSVCVFGNIALKNVIISVFIFYREREEMWEKEEKW